MTMGDSLNLLLIEDSEEDALLILRELRRSHFEVVWEWVQTPEEFLSALSRGPWDIIISDFRLPRFSAPVALNLIQQLQLDVPFIVVSGTIGEAMAVDLMKAGAHDYLMKDNLTRLPEAVRREMRDAYTRKQRRQAEFALSRNEAKNRAFLKAIPDLILLVGADGIYQEVVTAPPDLDRYFMGRNPVGLSVCDFLPPEIATRKLYHIEAALSTGQLQIYEQQIKIGGHLRHEEVRVIKSDWDEVLLMIRDVTERKRTEVKLAKRDRYLTILVEIQLLLLATEIDQTLYNRILELLATVSEADRIYIFENHTDVAGNLLVSQKAEWCAPGIEPQIDNPDLQNLRFEEDLPTLFGAYSGGSLVNGPITEIPDPEHTHLKAQGICSILEVPLLTGSNFFGFIGFDDCSVEKYWDALEVDMLRSIATAIALAKEREQAAQAIAQLNQELEARVEQRTAELQESEAKLHAILDSAPATVYVKDFEGRHIFLNREFGRLFNASAEQLMGKTNRELFPIKTAQKLIEHDHKVMTEGTFQEFEETVEVNGQQYTFLSSKFLLRDSQGTPYALCGISINISDRFEAQQRLQASEEKFRNLVENANDIIYTLSVDGVFTYVSPNWTEILGHEIEEVLYQPFQPFVHPEDVHKCWQTVEQVIGEGKKQKGVEYRVKHKDGTWRWHVSNASPQYDSENNVIAFLGIAHDITDRKQSEAQLQLTNHQLARATQLKDEFLANMSHELRTPLNAILGMAEGLQEDIFGTVNERQRSALETIQRSGSHLLSLINDILDLSKVEAGQMEFHFAPIPISILFQSSLAFVRQQALKKNIRIRTELPPYVPDLMVDERRINQVLINLLTNAVKFTPEGGKITLKVDLLQPVTASENTASEQQSSPNFVRLRVIDTGIGIAPEDIKKLFQPFVQINGALNRKQMGTGLGLSLVKRIVELHGGQVALTSEVGVGSCFMIDLPCVETVHPFVSAIPSHPSHSANSSAPVVASKSPLILLAEDNEANLSTMSNYLRAKGYRVLIAKTGREALNQAQSAKPDIILIDVQMPEMDGLEAMQKIRQCPDLVETPIIALTALAMSGDRDRCLAAGANHYLSKPVRLKDLVGEVQRLLATS